MNLERSLRLLIDVYDEDQYLLICTKMMIKFGPLDGHVVSIYVLR